jgi:hypothetical protein
MKFFFDDKQIPYWVEWLAVAVGGIVFGVAIGLIMLGYNLAHWIK